MARSTLKVVGIASPALLLTFLPPLWALVLLAPTGLALVATCRRDGLAPLTFVFGWALVGTPYLTWFAQEEGTIDALIGGPNHPSSYTGERCLEHLDVAVIAFGILATAASVTANRAARLAAAVSATALLSVVAYRALEGASVHLVENGGASTAHYPEPREGVIAAIVLLLMLAVGFLRLSMPERRVADHHEHRRRSARAPRQHRVREQR